VGRSEETRDLRKGERSGVVVLAMVGACVEDRMAVGWRGIAECVKCELVQ